MPETNLMNSWGSRALHVPEKPAETNRLPSPLKQPANTPAVGLLAKCGLRPDELRHLIEKGLATKKCVEKEVIDLVRLAHPDGWSVLLGLVTVTPALAERWLKVNFGNRQVSEDTVNAYARDLVAGMFLTTHQGIAFNDHDELIDGQHRLIAIKKAGVAAVLMVTFGWISLVKGRQLTRMDVIDRGRPRSVSDQLKIQHGLKNCCAIAQISTQLANLCCPERTRRLSVGQTLEIYHAFQPAVDYVIDRRSKEHGLKSAGVCAAFAFALMPLYTGRKHQPFSDGEKLLPMAELLERLNAGTKLKPDSSLGQLREFLVSDDAKLLQRSHDRGIAEMTLNAITERRLAATDDGVKHFQQQQPARVAKIAAMFTLPALKS